MPQTQTADADSIEGELLGLVYQNASTAVAMNLVTAVFAGMVLLQVLPGELAYGWLTAVLVVTAWRWFNARAFRHAARPLDSATLWKRRYALGALAAGVLWGVAGVLVVFEGELVHLAFIAFILGGLSAGSVALHAPVVSTYLVFLLPALLPTASLLLVRGDGLYAMLGLLILLFAVAMAVTVHRLNRSIARSIALHVENRSLVDSLTEAKKRLEESERTFRTLAETTTSAIFVWRENFLYVNPAAEHLTGYSADELYAMHFWDVVHPDHQSLVRERGIRRLRGEEQPNQYEIQILSKSGETRWLDFSAGLIDWQGKPAAIGTAFDITARKRAEEQLQLAASVFTHAREGIMITAADGTIIDVNEAFTAITGYGREEVIGQNPRMLRSDRHGTEFYTAMWRDLVEKGQWQGELWNRRKNGDGYAEYLTITAVRDAEGRTQHYVGLFSDITTHKEHQQQLEQIAHYDALTGLPNRVLLGDRLHQAMSRAQRHGERVMVAYLDLDGFKEVNDDHGHETGDRLLVTLASRMKHSLREGDTIARLGGDEFVAVATDLRDAGAGKAMVDRLLAAASKAFPVGELVLRVSASAGVTFYPQAEEVDADHLLRQADQAMYQAKLAGKNRYHVFDPEQDRHLRGYHESLERIRLALAQEEFVLFYQPKVNMRTGKVIGAEALIRWNHPEEGLRSPALFLPVIEDHPLAIDMGEWVIDTALRRRQQWSAAGLDIPVSVNISAYQLQQADFADRLRKLLVRHAEFKPGDLVLEVLETSALENMEHVSDVMRTCGEMGVSFALDDFGTGYSSLTYLKRLPAVELKIDRTFVRDMLDDPEDLAIVEGVLGLSRSFRRQAVAEGVETPTHGRMLLQLGCELAQGFGIARPMPGRELPDWCNTWRPDPEWMKEPAVSRDDLPLLFAGVEHRAWIRAVEEYLKGERTAAPPLHHRRCRFGQWLGGEGKARHGTRSAFHTIEKLHRRVHGLASRLLTMRGNGRDREALEGLDELYRLRDELLDRLNTLTCDTQNGATQRIGDGGIIP